MEIHDLLKQQLLSEWNKLSDRNISPYLKEIEDNFYVWTMRKSINESIESSRDTNLMERYHRQNLLILTRKYAETLYRLSNRGTNINEQVIAEAKIEMKGQKECDAYPC
jgi:hypothetical protein